MFHSLCKVALIVPEIWNKFPFLGLFISRLFTLSFITANSLIISSTKRSTCMMISLFLDFLIICEVFTVFSRFQHAGNSQTPVLTLNWLFIWSSQVFSDLSYNDTSVSGLLACMKLKLCHLLLGFVNQEIWSLRKAENGFI